MANTIWLSYSGFSTYVDECPQRYKWQYKDKKEQPVTSHHNALVGTVVQRTLEDFYNEEMWRNPKGVIARLETLAIKYFEEYLSNNYVNFQDIRCKFTQLEAQELVKSYVATAITAIKREKLYGPYARSEVVLRAPLRGNFYMYGKVDFILRRESGEILILDGKAKTKEEYLDDKQLLFYALLFYQVHNVWPSKLGFWMYPFSEDPEKCIKWVEVSKESIQDLKTKLDETFVNVAKKKFKATPSSAACRYCPWEASCEDKRKKELVDYQKKKWSAKGNSIPDQTASGKMSGTLGFDSDFLDEN